MTGPNVAPRRRSVPAWLVLVAAMLAVAAWLRSATAQDATPAATPAGSPVVVETVDCTEPLGLEPGSACVAVIHASPDAGSVDVYVDGEQVVEDIAFATASGYVAVPAGERQVQVVPAGASVEEAVIDQTLTFEAGVAYEVAATGPLASIGTSVNITNLDPLLDDDARIRVFQAIEGAPPADILLANGDPVLRNVTAGTVTGYLSVPAGATPIDLEVRPSGLPIAFPISGATLEPGLVYTFYVVGELTDPGSFRVVPLVAPASGSMNAGTPVASPEAIPLVPGTPMASPEASPGTSS